MLRIQTHICLTAKSSARGHRSLWAEGHASLAGCLSTPGKPQCQWGSLFRPRQGSFWGGGGFGGPCVTFRLVVAPLLGPGQSPVLPFACCVGSLRSVGRCGPCSCWCRFRVRGAQ